MSTPKYDVHVDRHGSLAFVTPMNKKAMDWFKTHTTTENWQWTGPTCTIELRYADDILQGMKDAGFQVEEGEPA